MRTLELPENLPFSGVIASVAGDDAMFDGRSDHYVKVGLSADHAIQRALEGLPPPGRILDMPCGHGRVTRMLRARYPEAAITVCDLDRSGVDFAAAQFRSRGVYSTEDFRVLDLSERYDLIWVGSLITHLSQQQTRRFLDFAARHLAPAGTLVVTSHGSFVAGRLLSYRYGLTDQAARGLLADAATDGYGYRSYPGGEGYGISLARRAWCEDLFADGPLRLDGYEEQGWDDHQDVLVLRPRPVPAGVAALGPFGRLRRWRAGKAAYPGYDAGSAPPFPAAEQDAMDRNAVNGFNEAWYLASDPKVAAAVAGGAFASGLDHYRTYGWLEARPFCPPDATYDARPRRASVPAGAA